MSVQNECMNAVRRDAVHVTFSLNSCQSTLFLLFMQNPIVLQSTSSLAGNDMLDSKTQSNNILVPFDRVSICYVGIRCEVLLHY